MGEEKYRRGSDYDTKDERVGLDDLIEDDEYEEILSRTISDRELDDYKERDDRIQVLTIWMNEKKSEQRMKRGLSYVISTILIIQIVYINIIVWKIGKGTMIFDEWTIRLFITGVFAEIVALVKIVVSNIFPKSGNKDFMDFINAFYFNKRSNSNNVDKTEEDM